MTYLDVIDLRVEYEKGVPTLDKFSLSVAEGELVSLLGPSGCGKTTTLRTIAGFIEPVAGQIVIAGVDNTRLTPNKRDIGLVFQSYALFPHLTAAQNVAFGLRMRGVRGAELDRRVTEALQLVDLAGFGDRRPGQLSGGQRQRVALARAVVIEPKLLMFDEPLSNLDAKLRVSVRTEIRRLQQRLGITTVYVTHDQVEALAISDRVIVMNQGRIEQSGKPEHIFKEPLTPFAADFMGFDNTFTAAVESIEGQQARVRVDGTRFRVEMGQPINKLNVGDTAKVFFRSENANLAADSQENSLPGTVLLRTFQGSHVEYIVETELGEFVVQQAEDQPRFEMGPVHLVLNPQSLIVLADR